MGVSTTARPAIAWHRGTAVLAAVYGLPAATVAFARVPTAFALAVGVIPAAAVGLLPTRRARWLIVVVGGLTGLSMLLGSLLAETPWLAVPAIVALGVGAAWLARRARVGSLMLNLSVPMVGAGLSFPSVSAGAELALAMSRARRSPAR